MLISQAYCWKRVLKIVSLSKMYSATAIQFPLIATLCSFVYGDEISLSMVFGMCLITTGVACLLWKSEI